MNALMTLTFLAAAVTAAADQPADDAVKKELARLEGGWQATSLEYDGKAHEEVAKQLRLVFKGDAVEVEAGEQVRKEYGKLTVKIDPTTTPKIMDITVAAGEQKDAALEGIYELKGDELKLCVRVIGTGRPAEFAAPEGANIALAVLKREKK